MVKIQYKKLYRPSGLDVMQGSGEAQTELYREIQLRRTGATDAAARQEHQQSC